MNVSKNFSSLSTDFLMGRKAMLESKVQAHEKTLTKTRTFVFGMWLTAAIRDDKEEIRQIEAELAYREKHSK